MTDLDRNELMKWIPHRDPFLLIDHAEDFQAGESLTGVKNVTPDEPYFPGHFPGKPVMPGVLILEAMAQTGAALAANILERVRKLRIAAAPTVGGSVSISIGVASLTPRSGMLAEILLQQADSALYEAKRNGRNQLVLAEGADGDAINDPDAPPADSTQPSRAG